MNSILQDQPQQLAEYQGLYGNVIVPERLVQQLWKQQDFSTQQLITQSGAALQIKHPGRWNTHEGPDFIEAELYIDGRRRVGNIEIHLYADDWYHHKHHLATHFKNVILHVVVFPPRNPPMRTHDVDGREIDLLVLLPYLNNDFESYANEQSLLQSSPCERSDLLNSLLAKTPEERFYALKENALQRYQQKRLFLKKRLEHFGWKNTCHQYSLEVLGYRRNRVPMSNLAMQIPMEDFIKQRVDELFGQQQYHWTLNGIRPANQPKRRLQQYQRLLRDSPNWTDKLLDFSREIDLKNFTQHKLNTQQFRRKYQLPSLANKLQTKILYNHIGGKRFHTWCVDAAFPLIDVHEQVDLFPLWFNWYLGDMPEKNFALIKQAELPQTHATYCNGLAQGLLGLATLT